MKIDARINALESKIEAAYTGGQTLDEAEKLAAEFLHATMQVSAALKTADLDARMRKSGNKAVRAAVYLDIVGKADKKPTEAAIDHMINTHDLVSPEQDALDRAEVDRDELERLYNVFQQAHVYFRQISKGSMG